MDPWWRDGHCKQKQTQMESFGALRNHIQAKFGMTLGFELVSATEIAIKATEPFSST